MLLQPGSGWGAGEVGIFNFDNNVRVLVKKYRSRVVLQLHSCGGRLRSRTNYYLPGLLGWICSTGRPVFKRRQAQVVFGWLGKICNWTLWIVSRSLACDYYCESTLLCAVPWQNLLLSCCCLSPQTMTITGVAAVVVGIYIIQRTKKFWFAFTSSG